MTALGKMGWRRNNSFKGLSGRSGRRGGDDVVEGLVFNIQKFSIHDGPGIRTTVFLKGCPLRCPWCSNPESINPFPEVLAKFENLCLDCGRCNEVCPREAIVVTKKDRADVDDGGHMRSIDRDLCERCMKCVEVCPSGALSKVGEVRTVGEIMGLVEQDRLFYETSGGGITLSGGEPLLQPHFTLALLREAKRRSIHTAVDTSGHAPREVLEGVLPYVDLVLFDIKHADPVIHRDTVGVDNLLIFNNLEYLSGKTRIWIRVPLIPGFNDDKAGICAIAEKIRRLCFDKLCILPYHNWGSGKYAALGRSYPLSEKDETNPACPCLAQALFRAAGVQDCEIVR